MCKSHPTSLNPFERMKNLKSTLQMLIHRPSPAPAPRPARGEAAAAAAAAAAVARRRAIQHWCTPTSAPAPPRPRLWPSRRSCTRAAGPYRRGTGRPSCTPNIVVGLARHALARSSCTPRAVAVLPVRTGNKDGASGPGRRCSTTLRPSTPPNTSAPDHDDKVAVAVSVSLGRGARRRRLAREPARRRSGIT